MKRNIWRAFGLAIRAFLVISLASVVVYASFGLLGG